MNGSTIERQPPQPLRPGLSGTSTTAGRAAQHPPGPGADACPAKRPVRLVAGRDRARAEAAHCRPALCSKVGDRAGFQNHELLASAPAEVGPGAGRHSLDASSLRLGRENVLTDMESDANQVVRRRPTSGRLTAVAYLDAEVRLQHAEVPSDFVQRQDEFLTRFDEVDPAEDVSSYSR